MSSRTAQCMSSAPSLTEVQEVFEALGPPGTPFTTTEVATRFECTDRTIYNRLETLVEDGVLETKKVGARGRIWWRPVEGDGENERNTEETYQKLFDSTNEGLCIIEVLFDADEQPVDYRFLETNPPFDELTGLRDAAGKRIHELDVDHNDYWIEKYGAVAQTGDPIQFTEYAEHLGERWYEINAFRIGDPTEHTVAVLFHDITENKHAENAVDEGEKRLEALLEATTEGVYRISPDWSEIYQLAGKNFIADDPPNTWQEYIPEDDRERVGKAIEEAIETQSPFELEHRITRADGTIGWVDSRAVPIVEDGEIVEWVGTATDITERKEREQEIKTQREWREAVFNGSRDAVFISDSDAAFVDINDAATDLTGYDRKELLSMRIPDLHEETDMDAYREYNDRILAGESITTETQLLRADGSKVHVEFDNKRIEIDGNVYMHTTARDVSKRKEREAELRRHEIYLESMPDHVSLVDQNGIIRYDSPSVTKLLGYDSDERLGDSGFNYIHPDDRDRIKKSFHESVTGSATIELYEYRAKTKDGGWVWVESSARNLTDDPDVGGVIVSVRDITKREEERRQRETLIDNLPGIAYRCRNEKGWPMDAVGGECEELTGYAQSAFESGKVSWGKDIIHPDDRDEVWETIQTSVQQNDAFETTYRIITRDGDQRWMWERGKRVSTTSGSDPVIEGFITDITEREQLEREQQQVIDRVTDGIFETDAEDRFVFVSDKGAELLNTPKTELLDEHIWDVFEGARGTPFEEQYYKVMETREPTSFIEYYPELDKWFDAQVYPDDDGGIAVYFRDVTERKERKQARKRAEKQYQTLLETAPDPIVAVDTECREIIEANQAAEELFGLTKSDLIGRSGLSLHPAERNASYETFMTTAIEEEGRWRYLSDGSPIHAETSTGEQIPVEISVRTLELGEGAVAFGIFRDISEQLTHERRLKELNKSTRELLDSENISSVEQTAVETLDNLLNVSAVGFYHFYEKDSSLQPTTTIASRGSEQQSEYLPVVEAGVGAEWRAFSTGQTVAIDDFWAREMEYESERAVRSEVVVPVADYGCLVVSDTQPAVFTDQEISLVKALGAAVKGALGSVEREERIRNQRRGLQQIESINKQIRDIAHAVVESESRTELEQTVCDCLLSSELVDFAWVGRVDFSEQQLSAHGQAGDNESYLDNIALGLEEGGGSEPSVQAARSRGVCSSSNVPENIHRDEWRSMALEQGFKSVQSIPLVSQETLYGVLSVYTKTSSGFPEGLQSVLGELGDLIAHAVVSIERKQAMYTQQTIELDLEIQDPTCFFGRLTDRVNSTIELDGIVPQSDQSTLVFIKVTDGSAEQVREAVKKQDEVRRSHLIKRTENDLLKTYLTKPSIPSVLSEQELKLKQLVADDSQCQVTVEVPQTVDAREAMARVTSHYENVQLLAKREASPATDSSISSPKIIENLTDRQREVIDTAYRCGYFDSPRGASGKGVAELLDLSNATFHQHVRNAEKTVFEALLTADSSSFQHTSSSNVE